MFTPVYLFTRVYLSLALLLIHVFLIPIFTRAYLSLPFFTCVYLGLQMFAGACYMFTHVYSCLPMFTPVTHV